MIIDVGYWTRILKNILMLTISLVLIFLAFKLAVFYMPFLIGFIISLLIEPLIKLIVRKTKIERKRVAIFVLIIIFGILIGLLSWGIFSLITESSKLLQGFNTNIEMMYGIIKDPPPLEYKRIYREYKKWKNYNTSRYYKNTRKFNRQNNWICNGIYIKFFEQSNSNNITNTNYRYIYIYNYTSNILYMYR